MSCLCQKVTHLSWCVISSYVFEILFTVLQIGGLNGMGGGKIRCHYRKHTFPITRVQPVKYVVATCGAQEQGVEKMTHESWVHEELEGGSETPALLSWGGHRALKAKPSSRCCSREAG